MAKKRKVLHVLYSLNSGGAESFILNVYRNIDRSKVGFDFLLRSPHSNEAYLEEVKEMGSKVYVTSAYPRRLLRNAMEVSKIIKQGGYEIVHVHANSLFYVTPLILAKMYHVPCRIVHSHNSTTSFGVLCKSVHYFNRNFIDFFVTHKLACGKLAGKWMYGNRKFQIVSNAVEIDQYLFDEDVRNRKREELGIGNRFVVGMVGRLSKQKNHEFMLKVFSRFVKQYCSESGNLDGTSCKKQPLLLLVGEGELRNELEEMVKKYHLEKYVMFTGQRQDVNELLMAMDLFVLPSFYEGLPFALVEAQVAGLPCLVSDTVTDEVTLSGKIEYLPISIGEKIWVDRMMKKYNSDEKEERKIHKKKFRKFDIHHVSKAMQNFYEDVS
ncbi:MAG: glycosyltransferase family 1 protein [Lachnospiraceae bacterium]|nr:glycosyltransferase family 1 protein [Lachnospiraceae bacterium]